VGGSEQAAGQHAARVGVDQQSHADPLRGVGPQHAVVRRFGRQRDRDELQRAAVVTSGELSIINPTIGVIGAGTTASPLVLTGTLAAINATLAPNGLNYTPADDFVGTVTLTMTSNDGGNTRR